MLYEKELHFARSLAMHAGEIALGHQTRGVVAESKSDLTPVTIADKECERFIARRIEEEFPEDGILGEEGSNKQSRNGRRWIVDPIDGTRDFIRGLPLWSTLIGFEVNGNVVAGVANMPPRKESYSAIQGGGAWRNDHRISISKIESPATAIACINGVNRLLELPFGSRFLEWISPFWAVRSFGGCVDAALLASGQVDLWVEPHAAAWDLAPFKIIFDEVGIRFLNFDGGSSIYGGNGIAFVPSLEPTVRSLLEVPVGAALR